MWFIGWRFIVSHLAHAHGGNTWIQKPQRQFCPFLKEAGEPFKALIPKSITGIHKTALNVLFTKLHLQPPWWNHYKTAQEAQKNIWQSDALWVQIRFWAQYEIMQLNFIAMPHFLCAFSFLSFLAGRLSSQIREEKHDMNRQYFLHLFTVSSCSVTVHWKHFLF